MMKFNFVVISLLLLFLTQKGFCQSKSGNAEITYLHIKDSLLISSIQKLVKQVETTDTLYRKGYGYITLQVKEYSQKDTLIDYSINPSLLSIREDSIDQLYPDHYTYVNNRLVLIHINVLNQLAVRKYTEKSKSEIRKLVNSTLEKTRKVTFYDVNEKKAFTDKHFRVDYLLRNYAIHLYILKNKPAVIFKELY